MEYITKDVEERNENLKRDKRQGSDAHVTSSKVLTLRGKGCSIPLLPRHGIQNASKTAL